MRTVDSRIITQINKVTKIRTSIIKSLTIIKMVNTMTQTNRATSNTTEMANMRARTLENTMKKVVALTLI